MPISLPSNANVGHLKKQAKQLLKACRNDQPEAKRRFVANHPDYASGIADSSTVKLQEAQLVIAKEYGAASWVKLLELTGGESEIESDDSGVLLMTNGTMAVQRLEAAGVPGHKEEWLEALCDGPAPLTESRRAFNQIRARHFERLGWTSYDGAMSGFERRERVLQEPDLFRELQLWFEHDVYDQLQLIQLLDYLSEQPAWLDKLKLAQFDDYLGRVTPERLVLGLQGLSPVTPSQIELAKEAWTAFRQPHPGELVRLLSGDLAPLPHLQSAVLRLCQEFPAPESGLGRNERQILEVLSKGERSPCELFRECQLMEEAVYLGDSSFYMIVDRLTRGANPLISINTGNSLLIPSRVGGSDAFRKQRVRITDSGQLALQGQMDRLADLPEPYWIGGCEIRDDKAPRWNLKTREFIPASGLIVP